MNTQDLLIRRLERAMARIDPSRARCSSRTGSMG